MKNLFLVLMIFLSFILPSKETIGAEVESPLDPKSFLCPDSKILGSSLITDVCWSGMFPLYVAGTRVKGKSSNAPADRNKQPLCACGGDIEKGEIPNFGPSLGIWLPKYLITVVKKPYCFPELGGVELGSSLGLVSRFNMGNEDVTDIEGDDANTTSSFSWHLAAFPLAAMLELFDVPSCTLDGYTNFDLIWISETIPVWYDDELAFAISPESIAFANPIAQAARIFDCASSSIGIPQDELFFSAGCWGSMYPLTQNTGSKDDKVASKSLVAARALYLLSRIGIIERTMGNDALCRNRNMPILKKSQFKFQQLWPMSESESMDVTCQDESSCDGDTTSTEGASINGEVGSNNIDTVTMNSLNETCTHPIGQTTWSWGMWRDAMQSSFASYLVFQWNDCCIGVLNP
ncbi:MAG: conjugal transfer pilus assembly protein TraU [Colwellia sp.]|jgi:conjugal transfer pilus assembly protein TraU